MDTLHTGTQYAKRAYNFLNYKGLLEGFGATILIMSFMFFWASIYELLMEHMEVLIIGCAIVSCSVLASMSDKNVRILFSVLALCFGIYDAIKHGFYGIRGYTTSLFLMLLMYGFLYKSMSSLSKATGHDFLKLIIPKRAKNKERVM